jgi:sugar phosphate isomerase/epimerase
LQSIGVGAFDFKAPIHDSLAGTRALGTQHCELAAPQDVSLATVSDVARVAAEADIHVTAVATLAKPNQGEDPFRALEEIRDTIQIAALLGAPRVITYFGANPRRSDEAAIERYAQYIRGPLGAAKDLGIELLVENHFSHAPGDVTSTAYGCLDLLEAVSDDSFGLNFDICNFAIGGEDTTRAYGLLQRYIRNVHVKDAKPFDPILHAEYDGRVVRDLNHGQFIFTAVRTGITDNEAILRRVKDDALDVPITVEAHVPAGILTDVLAAGLELCREVLDPDVGSGHQTSPREP